MCSYYYYFYHNVRSTQIPYIMALMLLRQEGTHLQCRTLEFYPWVKKSLEESMGIHCSILAWRIPWAEKPGRQASTGSERVR